LGTAVELIQAAGYQRVLSIARAGRAYLDWYTGRWTGLAQSVAQLAEVDVTDQLSVRIEAREIQALVELAVGSRRSAEQQLSAVLDGWSRLGPLGCEAATSAAALGRIRLAEGSAEQALQLTGPVMARIAKKELWLWATDALPVHFDALAGTGSYAQAEDLAGELAGWLACRNAPAPAAAAMLCQAIMAEVSGDLNTAAGLFAKAAQAWAGLPRPYDELRALERQGRCLLTTGEIDLGLVILSKAQQRLQELGARWDAARVARALRQHGVEVPHSWRGGHRGYGDRLSPRERDVVALVAQGMTNREVGQAMFLSPKTVGLHLHRAMRKLGVSTRTAAAMAAAEAGLIPATSPDAPAGSSANE
jgi:DNA-binding CsgD family transcriptional regulator